MNIGEKIQIFRKSKGMSQEDLAHKLLVSRQTVSLWETGRTLPTIDNLVCLKNVFGMTLDDILCQEHKEDADGYPFTFSQNKSERKAVFMSVFKRDLFWKINILLWIIFAAAAVLPWFGLRFALVILAELLFASLLFAAFSFNALRRFNKNLAAEPETVLYKYWVSGHSITIDISGRRWGTECLTVEFDKIDKLCEFDTFYYVELERKLYPIPKDAAELLITKGKKIITAYKSERMALRNENTVSFYLTAASAVGMILSLLQIFYISENGQLYRDATYMFFAFAAIPLAQLAYGTVRCFKKKRGLFNIIIGVLFLIVFCTYGSFGLIFRA